MHAVADDANTSAGQAPDEPVQLSATSHTPATPRHTAVLLASVQVVLVPWMLHPLASFEHVTSVLLEHVGPVVPVHTGSALQVQLALPDGPVQL